MESITTNRQYVKNLFHEAVEMPRPERKIFLDENCGNADVRREIESLLEAYEQAENFIETPAVLESGIIPLEMLNDIDTAIDVEYERTGEKVGNYEIIREIGRGGMGAVYLAARSEGDFRQEVAVKIVKRGMDTDFVIKRFRQERQILASLNHPYIAKLFEGGTTTDGLPYFVMEFVQGENLMAFCLQNDLDLTSRLKLFRQICEALTYAHQNLVVHRDLKPSNILITADGTPKLLDFGIAKFLSDDQTSPNTTIIYRLLTPEYASPEQIRGEKIRTTTDVYSLGVILYELLTSQSPYQTKSKNSEEIIRAVCETEPVKPSEATSFNQNEIQSNETQNPKSRIQNPKSLKGDLDNIVLKALQKESSRRYASVQEFSEDIRRYLVGLPVSARPDTISYRVGKFVSRHKTAVFASFFFGFIILLTTTFAVRQAIRANAEREKAQKRFAAVREMSNSMLFDLHDAIEKLPGATPARKMLIEKALPYLDNLAQEAAEDDSLQNEIAQSYRKLGEIQGHPAFPNVGDVEGGFGSFRKSIKIGEELVTRNPANREYKFNLATYYDMLGDMYGIAAYKTLDALDNYQKALQMREELSRTNTDDPEILQGLSMSYERIGNIKVTFAELDSAGKYYRDSLMVAEKLEVLLPDRSEPKRYLYLSYSEIGLVLKHQGKYRESLEQYTKSRALVVEQSKSEPDNNDLARMLGIIDDNSANAHLELGEIKEATELAKNALEIRERLFAADQTNIQLYGDLTVSLDTAGFLQLKAKDTSAALKLFRRSLEMREAAFEQDPTMTLAKRYIAISRNNIAAALRAQNKLTAALEQTQKALSANRELCQQDSANLELRRELAVSLFETGETQALIAANEHNLEKWDEARILLQESLSIYNEMISNNQFFGADSPRINTLKASIEKYEQLFSR